MVFGLEIQRSRSRGPLEVTERGQTRRWRQAHTEWLSVICVICTVRRHTAAGVFGRSTYHTMFKDYMILVQLEQKCQGFFTQCKEIGGKKTQEEKEKMECVN